MSRTFTIKPVKPTFGRVAFPTDRPLALYIRQSRGEQVENNPEAFIQQTQGLLNIALELGWTPDCILPLFIENQQVEGTWKHASGTKRIDERPILQSMVGYIERDEVKAVLVWLVDRLFRDEDGAEAPAFARICKEHNCLVLTSTGDAFDFTNRRDYKRFLQEADAASEFITHYLRGRALPARKQKALRGEYDGRVVPVGFTVESKAKGVIRRYSVYEEHARVVRWIFRRYRQLGGNFAMLCREIGALPYVFPFFPPGVHVPPLRLGRNACGYTISDRGLKGLLTNVAYIGWWYNEGAEVRKDNHPAIVPEGDFWYAFDRLSPVTVDGEPREKIVERARYNNVGTVPYPALLNGILKSEQGMQVYVNQVATGDRGAAYTIINNKAYYGGDKQGSIYVKELDHLFTTHLLERLEQGKALRQQFAPPGGSPDGIDWCIDDKNVAMANMLVQVTKAQQENTAGLAAQIAQYTEEADSLEHTLHYGSTGLDSATVARFSTRLGNLRRSIEQLETKKKRADEAQAEVMEFLEKLDEVPAVWHTLGIEKQRHFLKLICDTMVLTKPARNWLQLEVVWKRVDVPSSRCYIWQRKIGEVWTDAENALLATLYPRADRNDILLVLPSRSWTAIQHQAFRLKLYRPRDVRLNNSSDLHKYLSVEDQAFMDSVGITFDSEHSDVHAWWFSSHTLEGSLCSTSPRLRSRKRYGTYPGV